VSSAPVFAGSLTFLFFSGSKALTGLVDIGEVVAPDDEREARMSGGPKLFKSHTWAKPSSSQGTNGGKVHSVSNPDARERQTTFKVAQFFILSALLLVLADYLGRVQDRTGANLSPDSMSGVQLNLFPAERSGNGSGFTVRFRLSNNGSHSVFYPTGATTKPVGELVARVSSRSDWMSFSATSKQPVPPAEGFGDTKLNWIEMPPGGWVDGEFQDVGKSTEEHAYEIYVKVARDGKRIRIISQPYFSPENQ
jgi:hypothetical protein